MIAQPILARDAQVSTDNQSAAGSVVVFEASTTYGMATLAAGIDAGLWPDSARRILLIANNSPVPETAPALNDSEGFDRLATRFTEIWSFNEIIHPHHPGLWNPRTHEYPVLSRYLELILALPSSGPDQLVVESVHVSPAKLLSALFSGAGIDVYSEGLMSYGPTRGNLAALTGRRVERVIYPDLIPGLTPLLLQEWSPEFRSIGADNLRTVFEELAAGVQPPEVGEQPVALVLGQYLSSLGLMTITEEAELYASLVAALARAGHTNIVFKPHPNAPAAMEIELAKAAAVHGAHFTVLREQMLSEVLLCLIKVGVVVGSFSTGLVTAQRLFGVPAHHTYTLELAAQLAPLQNSNRFPLALINSTLPDVTELAPAEDTGDSPDGPAATTTIATPDPRLIQGLAHTLYPRRIPAPAMSQRDMIDLIAPLLPNSAAAPSPYRDAAAVDPGGRARRFERQRTQARWAKNKVVKAVAWRLRKGVTKVEKRLTE